MTRFILCLFAAIFMILGLVGLYMFLMAIVSPFESYLLQEAVERNGLLYPIILMALGLASWLFYLSFLRHARGTVDRKNPLTIDRLTGAMKDSW